MAILFHHSSSRVAELIRTYEAETGEIVPRRGTAHDMGRTLSHKKIICRKAYREGKPPHVIARETDHSPEAVDHYLVNLSRVYFAVVQRGMTLAEAAFATQLPVGTTQRSRDITPFWLHSLYIYADCCLELHSCIRLLSTHPRQATL